MVRFILLAALMASAPAAATDTGMPGALPEAQEAAALRTAEATGRVIYRHDQAATVATDVALADRAFRSDGRLDGWITEEQDGGIVVTFIDDTPSALYRVTVSANGVAGPLEALDAPTPLSPHEQAAARARSAALASGFEPCTRTYNSVVLPPGSPAGPHWVVYLLPGTTDPHAVPIGGTYRFDVDGTTVVSQRGFTRTCIALQKNEVAEHSLAFLMITHLLDPIPTEAHVFWSLWAQKPMYVSTVPKGSLWLIEDGTIQLIERDAAEG